jgi:hypothetical protein
MDRDHERGHQEQRSRFFNAKNGQGIYQEILCERPEMLPLKFTRPVPGMSAENPVRQVLGALFPVLQVKTGKGFPVPYGMAHDGIESH